MDEDEVNLDDTEIWDPPALPEVTHEAAEVSELPEAAPEALDPETAFEDAEFEAPEVNEVARDAAEFEAPEVDELAEVTPEAPANDFAHDEPVLETQSAEDLPGMSFETEEIPEYLDDVDIRATEFEQDLPEVEREVPELDDAISEFTPEPSENSFDFPDDVFRYNPANRVFPGAGHATANTFWMG